MVLQLRTLRVEIWEGNVKLCALRFEVESEKRSRMNVGLRLKVQELQECQINMGALDGGATEVWR